MAQNLRRTPHPNFLDMRRAYRTKISLGLCSFFFVCTIGRRVLRRFLRIKNCHDPLIFAIFLVEPLVSASVKQVTTLPWHITPKRTLYGPIYGIYMG